MCDIRLPQEPKRHGGEARAQRAKADELPLIGNHKYIFCDNFNCKNNADSLMMHYSFYILKTFFLTIVLMFVAFLWLSSINLTKPYYNHTYHIWEEDKAARQLSNIAILLMLSRAWNVLGYINWSSLFMCKIA